MKLVSQDNMEDVGNKKGQEYTFFNKIFLNAVLYESCTHLEIGI